MSFISGEQGNKGHFEGNRGTETIMGSREHKKTKNLRILLRRGISLNVICEIEKFLDCHFCTKNEYLKTYVSTNQKYTKS